MIDEITKDKVLNDFKALKEYAKRYFLQEDYSQSLCAIEMASKLMYTFNILYADDEMEALLKRIATKILINSKEDLPFQDKRVVFYDYFAIDNRGLTQQYIRALMALNYEILFITYDDNNVNKSKFIFQELNQYKKVQIYKIVNSDFIKATKELYDVINKFGPSIAFLHTAPWDVIGVLTWSCLSKVKRYLINLTDHAFWLGRCCSDYILEFRSYGYNISRKHRDIPEKKLILLPYYPIQNDEVPFEGFPFKVNNKRVIFSGGALYKIYGSNIFFDTVKYIVEKYNDTIVLYAGNGDLRPFQDFIKINHFQERVFLIEERKDFVHLLKNCYFYLGTYPLGGGLMSQYAVANRKIPVTYTEPFLQCNYIESLFININNIVFTHTNLKDYYTTIDNLLSDSNYKKSFEERLENLIITPKEFEKNLFNCLHYKKTDFAFEKFEVNIDKFSELYFNIENQYLNQYYLIYLRSKNIKLLLHFKWNFFNGILLILKNKILKHISGAK